MLTTEQLHVLQHALGVDEYGQGRQYRNHFCAGGGDEAICRELVGMGLMKTFERSYLPYYNCTVTDAGKQAMAEQSPQPPPPPKLTASQRRYRRFLDQDAGISFGEWLKYYGKDQPA